MVLWWQCAAGMDGWGEMQANMEMKALMIPPPLHLRHCGSRGCRASSSAPPLVCLSHLLDHQHTQQHQHAVVSPPSTSTPSIESTAKLLAGSAPALATAPAAAANGGRGGAGQGRAGRGGRQRGSGSYFKQHIILSSSTSLVQDVVQAVGVMISSRSLDDGPVVAM